MILKKNKPLIEVRNYSYSTYYSNNYEKAFIILGTIVVRVKKYRTKLKRNDDKDFTSITIKQW